MSLDQEVLVPWSGQRASGGRPSNRGMWASRDLELAYKCAGTTGIPASHDDAKPPGPAIAIEAAALPPRGDMQ